MKEDIRSISRIVIGGVILAAVLALAAHVWSWHERALAVLVTSIPLWVASLPSTGFLVWALILRRRLVAKNRELASLKAQVEKRSQPRQQPLVRGPSWVRGEHRWW